MAFQGSKKDIIYLFNFKLFTINFHEIEQLVIEFHYPVSGAVNLLCKYLTGCKVFHSYPIIPFKS